MLSNILWNIKTSRNRKIYFFNINTFFQNKIRYFQLNLANNIKKSKFLSIIRVICFIILIISHQLWMNYHVWSIFFTNKRLFIHSKSGFSFFDTFYNFVTKLYDYYLFKNILNDHYSFNINEKSSVLNQMILPLLPIIIATGNKKNALFGYISIIDI